MKRDKIQEAYEKMIVEKKVTLRDTKQIRRKLDEIDAVIKAGESPHELLSYLRTYLWDLMRNV